MDALINLFKKNIKHIIIGLETITSLLGMALGISSDFSIEAIIALMVLILLYTLLWFNYITWYETGKTNKIVMIVILVILGVLALVVLVSFVSNMLNSGSENFFYDIVNLFFDMFPPLYLIACLFMFAKKMRQASMATAALIAIYVIAYIVFAILKYISPILLIYNLVCAIVYAVPLVYYFICENSDYKKLV